jgi:hypothetical protein
MGYVMNERLSETTVLARMVEALHECCDDLQAEIDFRYGGTQNTYASEMRRYERDLESVRRARVLIAEWESQERG